MAQVCCDPKSAIAQLFQQRRIAAPCIPPPFLATTAAASAAAAAAAAAAVASFQGLTGKGACAYVAAEHPLGMQQGWKCRFQAFASMLSG